MSIETEIPKKTGTVVQGGDRGSQILTAGGVQTYRYYLVYYYGLHQHAGGERITRNSPLDSEDALLEEHERLEKKFNAPVVLWDWKRID